MQSDENSNKEYKELLDTVNATPIAELIPAGMKL